MAASCTACPDRFHGETERAICAVASRDKRAGKKEEEENRYERSRSRTYLVEHNTDKVVTRT